MADMMLVYTPLRICNTIQHDGELSAGRQLVKKHFVFIFGRWSMVKLVDDYSGTYYFHIIY